MSRFLRSARDALESIRDFNDVTEPLVRTFLSDLRLHFEHIGEAKPRLLGTYLDWNNHTQLSHEKHLRLLNVFSEQLAEIHYIMGISPRHPDYGSYFTTKALGMVPLYNEIRNLFDAPNEILILHDESGWLYWSFAYKVLISLRDRPLIGGELIFTQMGKLNRKNQKKYFLKCDKIIVYYLEYFVGDNLDDRAPRRIGVSYAAYEFSSDRIFERNVTIALLDKDDVPLKTNLDALPHNRNSSFMPNSPADLRHIMKYTVLRKS